MRIAVTSELHFRRAGGGVYTDGSYPYAFWGPLLEIFDEVVVIARVGDGPISTAHRRADGAGVRFAAVPDFTGVRGLARRGVGLAVRALAATVDVDAMLLRAPGVVATMGHAVARLRGCAYGIEVVGDPREALARAGSNLKPLAPLAGRLLAAQVRGAIASRYVTSAALQRRYPPPPGRLTIATSDVDLPDALFSEPAPTTDRAVLDVIFVGPLARPYKGVDVLLAALAQTARPHRLTIVGDGALRAELTADAAARGLADRVHFTGMVASGAEVFAQLRAADLFVLPSRTEGLPRALLEAMAVGLPCLATPVGGVPELLPPEALVAVDDPGALARAIDDLASAPGRRRAMAVANQASAQRFRSSVRRELMATFYRAIRSPAATRGAGCDTLPVCASP